MSEHPDATNPGRDRPSPAHPTEPVPAAPPNPTLPLSNAGRDAAGAGRTAVPGQDPGPAPGQSQPGPERQAGQQPPYAQPYGEQGRHGAQNPYIPPAGPGSAYPQYPQQPYGEQGRHPAPYGAPGQPYYNVAGYVEQKSRLVGGLLGILLGGLGIHRFYLGYTAVGIVQIVVTFLTFGLGAVWGFIEGIMILVGAEPFRRDARGVPLKE
ncbi:TM2 domain-containing protein [Arthrobacter mobilis]|uniref:NINE protein n=1 Tax=Arthrobacter mobilis TaxID=2724944 RepID=A0A7X6K6Q4_9MICC|nr:TM2 domain-containing protein [Arthrobacter mobilis]NKX56229.1 NINE protein [Arthrobacter mobilis]